MGVPLRSGDHAVIKSVHCLCMDICLRRSCEAKVTDKKAWLPIRPFKSKATCPDVCCNTIIVQLNASAVLVIIFQSVYMHQDCIVISQNIMYQGSDLSCHNDVIIYRLWVDVVRVSPLWSVMLMISSPLLCCSIQELSVLDWMKKIMQ